MACGSAWAQQAESATTDQVPTPPVRAPSGAEIDTLLTVLGVLMVLSVVLYGYKLYRGRVDRLAEQDDLAGKRFEAEIMATLRGTGETGAVAALESATYGRTFGGPPPARAASHIPPPVASTPPIASIGSDDPPRADIVAGAVIEQLRRAGMLASVEGHEELHGNRTGAAVLKLTDGRRAILVPHHESEAFARRQLKRFDAVFYVGRDGKAVVLASLENVIAEKLSGGIRA